MKNSKTFPLSDVNKVKRVPNRGHYDHATVYKILDDSCVCQVGFVKDNIPFMIPTIYGRKGDKLFFHGATSSRLIKHMCEGNPISICVTHIDGIVAARSAFHSSLNYRSVVAYGKAYLLETEEKMKALEIITNHVLPGRWEEIRLPNQKELKATSMLAFQIETASAKIRTGGPVDDKEDMDLDIWAGVIPFQTVNGEIIADEALKPGLPVSSSIKRYLEK